MLFAPFRTAPSLRMILFAPCDAPKIPRRLCIIPKGWPRAVLASRRSRRARLLGACSRARLATLAFTSALGVPPSSAPYLRMKRPSALSLARSRPRALDRVHLRVSPMLAFRRSRATPHRLTVHGIASSCHVSTRERLDLLPFEDRPFASHPANHVRPRLSTMALARAVQRRVSCSSFDAHAPRSPRFMPAFRRSCPAVAAR